ncbi:hypothetical protein BC629DRAFT_987277 [Irpex lacteus]|nr:hypothetical protein BC629DRAFT_987277 [Irpex lacteus]
MPTSSAITSDDKAKIKAAIPNSSNKILTAAIARIYYAYPDPNKWSYSGLQGALALAKDNNRGAHVFKLVDLAGTGGVVWEHEMYEGFEYYQDRPFFYSFPGDECMIGLVFADEGEAKTLAKKVGTAQKGGSSKSNKASSSKKKSTKGGKIDKSLISGPTGFKHVAHMGYDADKGFTSTNVDPSWEALLTSLESMGIDKETAANNMDFIKGFVRDAQANGVPAAAGGGKKKVPPPPPAPRRGHGQQDSYSAAPPSPAPPPPPAPPSRAPPRSSAPSPPPAPPPAPPSRPRLLNQAEARYYSPSRVLVYTC